MTVKSRPSIYFAAPLFSDAELSFNLRVTTQHERYVDVYLPQRDGGKVVDLIARKVIIDDAYRSIFDRDMEALSDVDVLLIILDGRSIDEGAAFELGVAHTLRKRCVGLQTDSRRLLPFGNNPMIVGALERIFSDLSELLMWVKSLTLLNRSTTNRINTE